MNFFWYIVGVALLLWVGWDLYAGYTVLHEVFYRDEDPVWYWGLISLWTVLGISCFFSSD